MSPAQNFPVERHHGTISLAPRIYEGGGPHSGRGESSAAAAGTLSVTLRVPALPEGEPRELRSGNRSFRASPLKWRENLPDEWYSGTTSLAPRIYEGGGPHSGRGEFPAAAGTLSVTASPCQLPQRGSRGRFAPFLPPAFMRGEGHAVAGGVSRAAGKASSVTASPCQLPQRGSRGRFAPFPGSIQPGACTRDGFPGTNPCFIQVFCFLLWATASSSQRLFFSLAA